jgi:UPF0716 protein FxsA
MLLDPLRNPVRHPMFARLGCLFVLVPLVELALLVQVGQWVGVLPTVGLVAVTGLAGAALARSQGLRALGDLRREAAAGRVPAGSFLDGASILVGGLLLLTPGILSDALGFALLLPPTRRVLQGWAMERMAREIRKGTVRVTFMDLHGGAGGAPGAPTPEPDEQVDRVPRPGEIIQD